MIFPGYLYNHAHLTRAVCCRLARDGSEIVKSLPTHFKLCHPEVCIHTHTHKHLSKCVCKTSVGDKWSKGKFNLDICVNICVHVGRQSQCVRLNTSHRKDQRVQCELEPARQAQGGGTGWHQGQSGQVREQPVTQSDLLSGQYK